MPVDLTLEFVELNDYVRHTLQVYVTWFTFFLTLLLGAMGWSLKASMNEDGKVITPFPFYCMVILFTLQIAFAVAATVYVQNDFIDAENRLDAIVAALKCSPVPCTNPFPPSLHKAMFLMKTTLLFNLVFWIVVAVLVGKRTGQTLYGGVDVAPRKAGVPVDAR